MIEKLPSNASASLTDFKRNPIGAVKEAGEPLTVISNNKPALVALSTDEYENLKQSEQELERLKVVFLQERLRDSIQEEKDGKLIDDADESFDSLLNDKD